MTSNWSISASFQYFFTFESALESWGCLLLNGRTFWIVITPLEELLAKMRIFRVLRVFGGKFKGRYSHIGVGWESALFGDLGGPSGSILGNIDHFIRTRLFCKICHFRFFGIFRPIFEGKKYDFFQNPKYCVGVYVGVYIVAKKSYWVQSIHC